MTDAQKALEEMEKVDSISRGSKRWIKIRTALKERTEVNDGEQRMKDALVIALVYLRKHDLIVEDGNKLVLREPNAEKEQTFVLSLDAAHALIEEESMRLKSKAQILVKALENIIKHQRTIIPTMKGAAEIIAEEALQSFSEREG